MHASTAQQVSTSTVQPGAGRIMCRDGLTLQVRQWGDGQPDCLLIHGFGDGGYIWDRLASELAVTSAVAAVDLRGHGESEWDARQRYDAGTHAADVIDIADALALERFAVVGHSLGGDIAIRVASACAGRISGLAIVDFGPEIDPLATDHIRAEFNAESRTYRSMAEYAARLEAKYLLASPANLSHLARHAGRVLPDGTFRLKRDPAMGVALSASAHEREQLWGLLHRLTCPVLVVRGVGSSVLARAVAERMMATLRNGSLAEIQRAGHAVMIDNPAGFAAEVLPFLSSVGCS